MKPLPALPADSPPMTVAMHEVHEVLFAAAERLQQHPARLMAVVIASACVAGAVDRDSFVATLDELIARVRGSGN